MCVLPQMPVLPSQRASPAATDCRCTVPGRSAPCNHHQHQGHPVTWLVCGTTTPRSQLAVFASQEQPVAAPTPHACRAARADKGATPTSPHNTAHGQKQRTAAPVCKQTLKGLSQHAPAAAAAAMGQACTLNAACHRSHLNPFGSHRPLHVWAEGVTTRNRLCLLLPPLAPAAAGLLALLLLPLLLLHPSPTRCALREWKSISPMQAPKKACLAQPPRTTCAGCLCVSVRACPANARHPLGAGRHTISQSVLPCVQVGRLCAGAAQLAAGTQRRSSLTSCCVQPWHRAHNEAAWQGRAGHAQAGLPNRGARCCWQRQGQGRQLCGN